VTPRPDADVPTTDPDADRHPDADRDGTSRRRAVRDGVALGLAAGAFGLSFGALATAAGLTIAQSCVLSLAAFTGGSQLAFVGVMAAGGSSTAAVTAAGLLGTRNTLYGIGLGPRLQLPAGLRPVAAHLVVDESTAMATAQPTRPLVRLAFTVTGVAVFVSWNVATAVGALAGAAVGDPRSLGLDVVGPAVFLALLWPRLLGPAGPGRTAARRVAAVGAALALIGTVALPVGLGVPVAALGVLLGGPDRGSDGGPDRVPDGSTDRSPESNIDSSPERGRDR